ncbi:hypothetical protein DUGA2_45330 [Duganella sp. HH101]|nr:hypothetical protein DUGA2_45330 [Duganella sp. HH101]
MAGCELQFRDFLNAISHVWIAEIGTSPHRQVLNVTTLIGRQVAHGVGQRRTRELGRQAATQRIAKRVCSNLRRIDFTTAQSRCYHAGGEATGRRRCKASAEDRCRTIARRRSCHGADCGSGDVAPTKARLQARHDAHALRDRVGQGGARRGRLPAVAVQDGVGARCLAVCADPGGNAAGDCRLRHAFPVKAILGADANTHRLAGDRTSGGSDCATGNQRQRRTERTCRRRSGRTASRRRATIGGEDGVGCGTSGDVGDCDGHHHHDQRAHAAATAAMTRRRRGRRGAAHGLGRVIRLEGGVVVVQRVHPRRDAQDSAGVELGGAVDAVGLGDQVPQLAVAPHRLGDGLQRFARALHAVRARRRRHHRRGHAHIGRTQHVGGHLVFLAQHAAVDDQREVVAAGVVLELHMALGVVPQARGFLAVAVGHAGAVAVDVVPTGVAGVGRGLGVVRFAVAVGVAVGDDVGIGLAAGRGHGVAVQVAGFVVADAEQHGAQQFAGGAVLHVLFVALRHQVAGRVVGVDVLLGRGTDGVGDGVEVADVAAFLAGDQARFGDAAGAVVAAGVDADVVAQHGGQAAHGVVAVGFAGDDAGGDLVAAAGQDDALAEEGVLHPVAGPVVADQVAVGAVAHLAADLVAVDDLLAVHGVVAVVAVELALAVVGGDAGAVAVVVVLVVEFVGGVGDLGHAVLHVVDQCVALHVGRRAGRAAAVALHLAQPVADLVVAVIGDQAGDVVGDAGQQAVGVAEVDALAAAGTLVQLASGGVELVGGGERLQRGAGHVAGAVHAGVGLLRHAAVVVDHPVQAEVLGVQRGGLVVEGVVGAARGVAVAIDGLDDVAVEVVAQAGAGAGGVDVQDVASQFVIQIGFHQLCRGLGGGGLDGLALVGGQVADHGRLAPAAHQMAQVVVGVVGAHAAEVDAELVGAAFGGDGLAVAEQVVGVADDAAVGVGFPHHVAVAVVAEAVVAAAGSADEVA